MGLLLGVVADAVLADPRHGHPVAGFGRVAGTAERLLYADSRGRGAAYAAGCVAGVVCVGAALGRLTRGRSRLTALTVGAAAWAALGGESLAREAGCVAAAVRAGDLPAARVRLPHLCGRDPYDLDAAGLSRATVESVAENTADAIVGPLLWGAVAGVPGILGYRAVNTLDAMVGHRSARYVSFGWAAARLDDVANWLPARVTGLLAAALAPLVGGSARAATRVLRRDGGKHPSPNAGRPEAAFAGALGVRLGGTNTYSQYVSDAGDTTAGATRGGLPANEAVRVPEQAVRVPEQRVEHRPELGDGRTPGPDDITRAVRLSRVVGIAAALLAALLAAGVAAVLAAVLNVTRGRRTRAGRRR